MKPITRYTFLGFYLNALLDHNKSLDIVKTRRHIEDGTIFDWLKNNFGDDIDLSLYASEDKKVILDLFQGLTNAVDAKRKMGVENNGIALLVAYCLEGIQELR